MSLQTAVTNVRTRNYMDEGSGLHGYIWQKTQSCKRGSEKSIFSEINNKNVKYLQDYLCSKLIITFWRRQAPDADWFIPASTHNKMVSDPVGKKVLLGAFLHIFPARDPAYTGAAWTLNHHSRSLIFLFLDLNLPLSCTPEKWSRDIINW